MGAAPPPARRIPSWTKRDEPALAFGPVGLAGVVLLLLGILSRRRLLALLGLAGVVADVTRPELGGFKALNEARATEPT